MAAGRTMAAANALHPDLAMRAVTDPGVLDQARVFAEALNQAHPMVAPGSANETRIADMIRAGTARPTLSQEAAQRMATSGRPLESLIRGPHPVGTAAEVVVASDYRSMHAGQDSGIVNPPAYVASNVHDIRLAPDMASRKDLVFGFKTATGEVVWKYNGQVKTGSAQYVADSLVKMANTPNYGKVAYVDARYVNADGTPRIAANAFTPESARQLQEAKVCLRGIPDLEQRSKELVDNIRKSQKDGLNPVAHEQLKQLREDISAAYTLGGVGTRIVGNAALAAASAALVSLIVQLASNGEVDAQALVEPAVTGAAFGAAGAVADAGFYHLGIDVLKMTPEAAKTLAQQGVAVGFCLFAVTADCCAEIAALRRGEVTVADAMYGIAAKSALDLLPLVLAPLGLAGIPLLIGVQMGGRWLIDQARAADRALEQVKAANLELANNMSERMVQFTQTVTDIEAECAMTDAIFNEVMLGASVFKLRK